MVLSASVRKRSPGLIFLWCNPVNGNHSLPEYSSSFTAFISNIPVNSDCGVLHIRRFILVDYLFMAIV